MYRGRRSGCARGGSRANAASHLRPIRADDHAASSSSAGSGSGRVGSSLIRFGVACRVSETAATAATRQRTRAASSPVFKPDPRGGASSRRGMARLRVVANPVSKPDSRGWMRSAFVRHQESGCLLMLQLGLRRGPTGRDSESRAGARISWRAPIGRFIHLNHSAAQLLTLCFKRQSSTVTTFSRHGFRLPLPMTMARSDLLLPLWSRKLHLGSGRVASRAQRALRLTRSRGTQSRPVALESGQGDATS
jgi:hypothetical protein